MGLRQTRRYTAMRRLREKQRAEDGRLFCLEAGAAMTAGRLRLVTDRASTFQQRAFDSRQPHFRPQQRARVVVLLCLISKQRDNIVMVGVRTIT